MKRAFQRCITCRMSYHPRGNTVEIVGVKSPTNGRSCEEHRICSEVVIEYVVLGHRKVQIQINQQEQSAIAAFWVSDGIDCCHVGYLPKAYVKNWKQYDGALVQVIEVYSAESDSLQSARSFIDTMVFPWQLSSRPQNHVLQPQRSKKQTVLHQNRLMVRVLQIRQ